MLVTCIANDWPTETYLSPEHPLQLHIRRTIEDLAREPVAAVGVDGCGAPLFALTLGGLARAFRALVLAEPGSPERQVADAMRKFPEWTSGTARDENKLMAAIPGLLLKAGAEGVDAFALPDGTAAALKIDDGSARARTPVTVAILTLLGAQPPAELAAAVAAGLAGGGPDDVIRAARLT
jgi:L-asparaginase II